jgi:murein DD-endopeptidase MepM/ murein hydrolase activator NlpD
VRSFIAFESKTKYGRSADPRASEARHVLTPVRICFAAFLALSGIAAVSPPSPAAVVPGRVPDYGSYSWPLRGRVIRGFEPPPGDYEAGHRGIDIAAAFGTEVKAAREGIVAFAGWVGGSLFVSIDHTDGVRTTYSWLSDVQVQKGQSVARGNVVARSGHGHPEVPEPHLHFGARVGSTYIDPMLLLEGVDVSNLIHLAPLQEAEGTAQIRTWPFGLSGVAIRGPPRGST